MNPLLLYCIKAGASLTLLYGCYRLFLVRLTFYRANRYYLAVAILLSVVLPLMDTSPLWPKPVASYTHYVVYWSEAPPAQTPAIHTRQSPRQPFQMPWVSLIFLAGLSCMAVRLLIQVISLSLLRKESTLLSRESGIGLYTVPEPIVPFSFGRSIYIHERGYSTEDLQRIIEHETAHVRERHTLDIILVQTLLLLQWWNPVAWLLNRSVRQNLEFLADRFVLSMGADRREYQYLLLKVSGINVPSLANAFNFSPLRNRIAMMNRNHSSKRQNARFLFALPLLLLLLAAFARKTALPDNSYHYFGFVVDSKTLQPLNNVRIDRDGKTAAVSDARGYFNFMIPAPASDTQQIALAYIKSGYKQRTTFSGYAYRSSTIEFVELTQNDSSYPAHTSNMSLAETEATALALSDGKTIEKAYSDFVYTQQKLLKMRTQIKASTDIYYVADGRAYITDGHEISSLEGPDHMVIMDDSIKLTGAELNQHYTREQLDHSNASYSRSAAKKKYGIDQAVFALYLKK